MLKKSILNHQPDSQQAHGGFNWWVLLWASVAFIVYGSLFPFDFQSEAKPIAQFFDEWRMFRHLADANDNFLLFIPLGVGLDACFRGRGRLLLACLVAWLVLGVGIQLMQLYLPSRTAALSDVLWNAVGMVFGVLAFKRVRLMFDHLQRSSSGQQDRYAMLLVAVWFCYESFPFVPTLDVGELRNHIKSVVVAPPFELMRLFQHALAAVLAGMAMLRANWLQPRWLNVLIPGSLAVILEIFVAYGSLRRETLLGIVGGLFVGYWLAANATKRTPLIVFGVAVVALLVTVLTPYRGQPAGATFTLAPFSYIFWWGITKDISPSAFEALAIGALFWVGKHLNGVIRVSPAGWVGGVFAALLVLEFFRVYVVGYHGDTTPLVLALVLASFGSSLSDRSHPQIQTESLPAHQAKVALRSRPHVTAPNYRIHVMAVLALSVLIFVVCHLPGGPYNLRELLHSSFWGGLSALGLALVAYGASNAVFLLVLPGRRKWLMMLPAVLAVHGVLSWWLLRVSVPMESLFDIVGSPVLDWPWEWEMLGRYVALHVAIMLQLVGAALCVRAILRPRSLADVLYWVVISGVMSWPLYLVVLQWAVTDNLTELIASNASFWAASALAAALFLSCFVASATAAVLAGAQRVKTLVILAALAAIGAATLYWVGTEHTIVKDGSVFSAFQFLLSTGRTHYAQGVDLMLRFGIAFLAVSSGLAALQWWSWRWLSKSN